MADIDYDEIALDCDACNKSVLVYMSGHVTDGWIYLKGNCPECGNPLEYDFEDDREPDYEWLEDIKREDF
jgi:hypothetical protein